MRRALLVCVAAFSLSGCAAFQSLSGTVSTATPSQLITDVEAAAVAACSFLPTAATVAGIIAVGNPALATASSIASAICAAVVPKPASLSGAVRTAAIPKVAGVLIRGQFIH